MRIYLAQKAMLIVVTLAIASTARAQTASTSFSATQRHDIELIVRDYLIENPEVLREASIELERRTQEAQRNSQTQAIAKYHDQLVSSRGSIVLGNPNGTVNMVAFFDYNCPFCRASVDDIQTLIEANPDLRVVLKEFPILGQDSTEASHVALAASRQFQNADLQAHYYRALMKVKGTMNGELALSIGEKFGLNETQARKDLHEKQIDAILSENMSIAEAIGVNGTPSFVIGNNLIVGAVGAVQIQQIIDTSR